VAVLGLRATRRSPRNRATWIAAASTLALGAAAGSSAWAASSVPTVNCDKAAVTVSSGGHDGYRVVLGVVSVPPAYVPQVVPTHNKYFRPWRFWSKAGLFVRAGTPAVVVSVPKAWQTRAAITWGNAGTVSALRLASCPVQPGVWNGYPGGFVLRASSACVPLVFRVGQQSTTVRFGVGRRCSGS